MNRTWLLNAAADLGSLILYVLALCGAILVAGFAVILVTRLVVEVVRTIRGKGGRRQADPVAVPFGGPGAQAGPVDMPPGFEDATPEAAAVAAERAAAAVQHFERAQMAANLDQHGAIRRPGTKGGAQ